MFNNCRGTDCRKFLFFNGWVVHFAKHIVTILSQVFWNYVDKHLFFS